MTGAVVWFTGLPGSGKSTLAGRVRERLRAEHINPAVLDSDELRPILHVDGYTAVERDELYRRLAALAVLLAGQDLIVLVAATAPRRVHRALARELAPRFVEVWIRTPLEVCEARDPKGLYARARRDATTTLPGIGVPYEPPVAPEVIAEDGDDPAALESVVGRFVR